MEVHGSAFTESSADTTYDLKKKILALICMSLTKYIVNFYNYFCLNILWLYI